MDSSKVWYVTGASGGLGLSLVKSLLDHGYRVAATSRNAHKLSQAVGVIDKDRFLSLAVDLGNMDCIEESVQQALAAFGRIDVVVNNAGYGMSGPVEATAEQDIKDIFSINVMATINVVKAVLPALRSRRSGHIINIGSVAGWTGAAGWSVYAATKAAVAAFSEVLAQDLKAFGIKVTVVTPSGFRTGFLDEGSLSLSRSAIEGYQAVNDVQERYLAANGQQPGDPERAAGILITLAENPEPPLQLLLGADAYNRASEKLRLMQEALEKWKTITISADFQV